MKVFDILVQVRVCAGLVEVKEFGTSVDVTQLFQAAGQNL